MKRVGVGEDGRGFEGPPGASLKGRTGCVAMRWAALLLPMVLLGGCAGDDGAGGPSSSTSGAPPAHREPGSWNDSPDMPGVRIGVAREDDGRRHTAFVTVENAGRGTYWYLWVPSCGLEPWTERMEGASGPVDPREPQAHCQPCGWDDLEPGARLERAFEWDERIWDGEQGAMRDAPEGRYGWTFTFNAATSPEDACAGKLSAEASLVVQVDR